MKLIVKNLDDIDKLAKIFAQSIQETGAFVCLYGDIGAGKTTFTKHVAKFLNVKENVTSPSFVILNEYHSGSIPLYHFDLYRLELEGVKTIADELEEYSSGKVLTMVEWAEYSNIELTGERMEIYIKTKENEIREFEFIALSNKYKKIVEGVENEYTNS